MAKIIATVLLMSLWAAASSWSQDQLGGPKPCHEHPQVDGPCFNVHGRIRIYNGTPSVRIWPVGTKRLLGVSEARFYKAEYSNMPPDLSRLLAWDKEIFADFVVCPFTPDEPRVMRLVCIDSASNIVVKNIPTQ
jgi:hypothetical protein